jgi:N-acetyl sugar amidotransferase
MIRCTRCLYPTTRPDSHFDSEGVCSGCRSFEQRKTIDWGARLDALEQLLEEAKRRTAPYDVVVPVSGGKDSTYQVIKLLELGAKVLAVNGATDMLSDLGRRNLDNLKRLCDVIEWTPNVEVRKKLVRLGLFRVGDMSWPEHATIWSIPTRVAAQMGIPYVVWGEQPQREYSRPDGIEPATNLDARWCGEFGGFLGMRLSDLVGEEGLTERDLEVFRFPSDDVLERARVKGIWLGDYIPWDGWKNAFIAQHYGFEFSPLPIEQSLGNYENLDNHVTVLRDWLRFLKYGYSRATDIASNHIRRGRLTRDEGLDLIALRERFPQTSIGKPIDQVLGYFGLTVDDYVEQCDRWTNPDIFEFKSPGFLIPADAGARIVQWVPTKDDDGTPRFKRPNGSGEAHHPRPAQ